MRALRSGPEHDTGARMSKRVMALVGLAAMVGLAACGGDDGETASTTTTAAGGRSSPSRTSATWTLTRLPVGDDL